MTAKESKKDKPIRSANKKTAAKKTRQAWTESCCFCAEGSAFFWKDLNASSATKVLSNSPVGSYLLRPSSQHPVYDFALSQKLPGMGVTHTRIGRNEAGLYSLESDDTVPSSRITGFSCVVRMLESWSRVCRENGICYIQMPVPHITAKKDAPTYVNDDTDTVVCFHEDDEADKSVREFVTSFIREKSLTSQQKNCCTSFSGEGEEGKLGDSKSFFPVAVSNQSMTKSTWFQCGNEHRQKVCTPSA